MAASGAFSEKARPIPRPQIRIRDQQAFFLISNRPVTALGEQELRIWAALDGIRTLAALRTAFAGNCDQAIDRFVACGICELAPPPPEEPRRKILVIEPHMDDGLLSLGGTMWSMKDEVEFTVLTVAGRSNFTSYYFLDRDFFDADQISHLRQQESRLAMELLAGKHLALTCREAPLRYSSSAWSVDWYRRHRKSVSAFIGHCSSEAELRDWQRSIHDALEAARPEELWLPLGVGTHTDHELTRNACLAILASDPPFLRETAIRFYQDVPYAAQFPGHTEALVRCLEQAGAALKPEPVDIGGVFAEKLRLVSIFGSQFKLEALRPGIEACAEAVFGGRRKGELLFKMERAPGRIEPLRLYAHASAIDQLVAEYRPWFERHRKTRKIRFLMACAAGRWAEDIKLLRTLFPEAHLEFHLTRDGLGEAEDHPADGVTIFPVGATMKAFGLRVLKLALGRGPLVILPGKGREKAGKLAQRISLASDTLVAGTMAQLALVMQQLSIHRAI